MHWKNRLGLTPSKLRFTSKVEELCSFICNCQALSEAFRLAITYKLQEIGVLICKYVLPENAFKSAITYKL